MRFIYSSMTTPAEVFDYDMGRASAPCARRQEVPSGHDPADYVTRRLFAPAPDGETVPVSLLYKKDDAARRLRAAVPLRLRLLRHRHAGGFSTSRLSLVDRGFIYAIAHIRGGKDKGYRWYTDGKLEKKTNTFTDFIAAGEYLVAGGLHAARPHRGQRRLGRRHADGRGRQHGARPLPRHHRRRAVRRRAEHHARQEPAADAAGVAGMGQSARTRTSSRSSAPTRPTTTSRPRPIRTSSRYAGLTDPRVTYWEPAKWIAQAARTQHQRRT